MSWRVSKEKDEKVVKPPSRPMNRKVRKPGLIKSASLRPASIPIKRDPDRFTASVPQGNRGWRKKETVPLTSTNRKIVPSVPPAAKIK